MILQLYYVSKCTYCGLVSYSIDSRVHSFGHIVISCSYLHIFCYLLVFLFLFQVSTKGSDWTMYKNTEPISLMFKQCFDDEKQWYIVSLVSPASNFDL